ncbi:MAG: B12-binding domain-containing radical SAM protein [Elusimicrobia bacterium]|nr:B12-binding domain-containing radical SAM protein [Elusimicrobiota bacterium]
MAGRVPLSLLHLHGYLKGEDFRIRIVDERTAPDIPAFINSLGNDVLCFGISSFTGIQIANGLKIAALLKAKFPRTPVIWGGWHPSSLPEQTLKHPLVDIVVRGPGEETFRELLHALSGGKPLSEVKGISYKLNGELFHNPDRELTGVLEKLRLSYDAIDVEKYIFKQPWGDRSIGIIMSLGCPFKCGFCAVASVYKCRTFYRDLDLVLEEIDYLVDKHRINAIIFDDDNFFVSSRRVREFCEKLINKPYKIAWDAGAHVGLLLKHYDDAALKLIKDSGCRQLYIGAESGSDEVLELIDKKATVAQTLEYVKKMKAIGIRSFLSTMACLPGTSSEDIYMTMEMLLKCRDIDPDLRFRLFYYTPYPATPLYAKALETGMKEPKGLEEWSQHTLRKFKAPWIKSSHRKQIRYFYFYYFPYSTGIKHEAFEIGLLNNILKKLFRLVFENILLVKLAKWRTRNSNYKFQADAFFVIQGQRLKSFYNHAVRKQAADLFSDYED